MAENKLQVLQFRPGVNREGTSYSGEGGWYACDKVRFRSGLPEKIGGWTPYGSDTYLGSCKYYAEWVSLSNYYLLGLGTNLKFYILTGGTYFDITPIRQTSTGLSNPFYPIYSTLSANVNVADTTIFVTSGTSFDYVVPFVLLIDSEQIYVQNAGGNTLTGCIRGYNGTTAAFHNSGAVVSSSWIVINDPGNGATANDFVTFSGATAFGPYTAAKLNAEYQIKAVNGNYFVIDIGIQSTSATQGGGTVSAAYQIYTGLPYTETLSGWGSGPWVGLPLGAGISTLSSSITSSQTTIPVVSAATFPSSGYAIIESEIIQYAGKTSTTLTGVTRGISGNATSHGSGIEVNSVAYSAGTRGWGTGYEGGGFAYALRLWSACNYGQDLFFNPRNGGIYYWEAATNLSVGGQVTGRGIDITSTTFSDLALNEIVVGNYYKIRSLGSTTQPQWNTLAGTSAVVYIVGSTFVCQTVISTGYGSGVVYDPAIPSVAAYTTVTDERYLVAFGCNDAVAGSSVQDPMLIAWSDQEQPQVWYPQVTNTASSFRLVYGSRIITVEKTRQEILIWTDTALYSMQYLGSPYVYGFNPLSVDVTIVSQNAMATAAGVTYWMGQDKFYMYSGRVDTLPCALRQYIFDDINTSQWEQVFCGTNEKYNEVWWFYPSSDAVLNDRYVVYNYLENLWHYGNLPRSAWLDSHILGSPLGAVGIDPAPEDEGITVQHETGADDGTTNPPTPIEAYIETSDFDIGDGGYQFSFVKRLIPDIDFIGSETASPVVTMTVKARNYPGQPYAGVLPTQNAPATVAGTDFSTQVYGYTREVWVRLRGRQLSLRVESDQLGVKWQLGNPRIQIQPDGRR
jgi:hypothetical protein